MPLPTFAPPRVTPPSSETLTRTKAAARLELHVAHVDKMVRAGMLPLPITAEAVERLSGRPALQVVSGELTVLRTDARRPADPTLHSHDTRRWIGFHVDHTDEEVEETSLRWWRSDVGRVLDNQLFVVTLATYPVAVYLVSGLNDTQTRPDEEAPRQHYAGTLLGRMRPGMQSSLIEPMPGHLRPLAKQILASRITVSSGGPIGYLEPMAVRST